MNKLIDKSNILWAFGFIVSIISGYLIYKNPQSLQVTMGLIIGLIAVIISLTIEIRVKVSEQENIKMKLSELVHIKSNLETLEKKLDLSINVINIEKKINDNQSIDPYFTERYYDLKKEIEELSNGQYHVNGSPNVYEDDIRSIRILKPGDLLRSTCPMATGSKEEVIKQIVNLHYLSSVKEHVAAAKRGVDVTRIYLFKNQEYFNIDEVKNIL